MSSRAAGILGQNEFGEIMKTGSLVSVETAKHMVNLSQVQRTSFSDKILEMVMERGFERVTDRVVVPRRRRDDEDKVDDVLFFQKQ